ncbi:VPA1262 family N-terminal domain-containing protein [Methanobacterium congolense]|uniref:Phospholipase D-like domain-containing protein n=1 Tax=Methanobacterium congolense TaxID=118062 RepID=A0A1D3L346_9EURY|nr:VPA1262 family N-terminal domain-containing protein [Methanobacterium congolense]SCG85975.1 putative protein [Methanobacterium congolense]
MGISEIKNDFDLLIEEGSIAFYRTAEITVVFLSVRGDLINVFTRITFEESGDTYTTKFMTQKLEKINDDISLGIIQQKVSLDNVKSAFERLMDLNEWVIDGRNIEIDTLRVVDKVLVPSSLGVKVNTALKSAENDSYIIEFFSEEVNILNSYLTDVEYIKMYKLIKNVINIDFKFLKDRIGNIIFQFPITLIKTNIKFLSDQVQIEANWHPTLKKIPEVEIFAYIICDDNIVGSAAYSGPLNAKKILECGNSDGNPVIFIKKKDNNLFLSFCDNFALNLRADIKLNLRKVRTLVGEDPINLYRFEPGFRMGILTEPYIKRIKERKYDELTDSLIKEKKFVEYSVDGTDEHERALSDIRSIIKNNCENGVYLWDPYADAQDILDTLYHCPCYNSELKVITSSKARYKTTAEDWAKQQINILKSNSDQKGINLEVRCQESGGEFHDRFLIFPGNNYDKPRVWALGCSINSIGNSHGILIEVKNAQNILDAFNDQWKKLDKDVIWKYP